jgi:hypothetical protein
MKHLMITWTDAFYAIGDFFYWCFKGMRALGQFPNVLMGAAVIILLAYWCMKIVQQNKTAERNGTYK